MQFNKFNYNDNMDFQILDNEIKNLQVNHQVATNHHVHHYTISYVAVICIVGIFLYLRHKLQLRLPKLKTTKGAVEAAVTVEPAENQNNV